MPNAEESSELAQMLVEECVERSVPGLAAEKLSYFAPELGTTPLPLKRIQYDAQVKVYLAALLVLLLLQKKEDDERWLPIIPEVEKHIFSSSPDTRGLQQLATVKRAMGDLAELIEHTRSSDRTSFHWSRKWLGDLELIETNPARLALFHMAWMDAIIFTNGALDSLGELVLK